MPLSMPERAMLGAAVNGICVAAVAANPIIILKSAALGALCSCSQQKILESEPLLTAVHFFGDPRSYINTAKKGLTLLVSGAIFFHIAAISGGIGLTLPVMGFNISIPMGLNYLFSGCSMTIPGLLATTVYEQLMPTGANTFGGQRLGGKQRH